MRIRRAAVLVVVLLAACSSSEAPPQEAADVAAVPGADALEVSLTQYRADVAPRRVQVKVRQTDGAEPVVVQGVSLELPGYAGPLVRDDLDAESRPGGALDLPVPLGDLDCAAADDDAARVVLLVGPDSAPLAVDVPLEGEESDGFVAGFREQECARQAVLDVVPLAWSDDWTVRTAADGLVADGVLRVGPVAAGHGVALQGVEATTLYAPRPTDAAAVVAPLDLAAGAAVDLPVTLAPARCDAHAVAEDKQGYLVPVRLSLDGGGAIPVVVELTGAARDAVEGMLLDRCGLR